jgi:hypothetical protein
MEMMSIVMKVARPQCQHASGEEATKDKHNSGSNDNGAGHLHCNNCVHPIDETPSLVLVGS